MTSRANPHVDFCSTFRSASGPPDPLNCSWVFTISIGLVSQVGTVAAIIELLDTLPQSDLKCGRVIAFKRS